MSELKVNKISPRSGTTITLGDSGDAISVASGASFSGLTLSDNILFNAASKGIYLGVTTATASNLLDDFEEGTWTPTYTASATDPTVSYLTQDGTYTKIGNRVYITCAISTSSVTSAGSGFMRVSGLPFASNEVGGGVSVTGNNDWGTNNYPSMGQIFTGESYVTLYKYPASPQDEFERVDASSLGSGSNDNLVRFFGSYITT